MARLTRDAVVGEGLAIADADGVDAVSLRRIAESLDVTPMALYRHVTNKADLLDAMADALYAELDVPDEPGYWWDDLASLACSTRRVLLAHPSAAALFSRPLAGPASHRLAAALADALRRAGFRGREITELHDQLSAVVLALVRSSRGNAAFERGLEFVRAGLEARRRRRYRPPTVR
jgi:AcrR family transcriptional regulator